LVVYWLRDETMRDCSKDIWIIIAAFNEDAVIHGVVAGITRVYPNVVVVDDGSTDFTASRASAAGAAVVTHPINLGQGAALQTGISFALSRGAELLVTFDADGQHRVADIASLLEALRSRDVDYALGSRFLNGGSNIPGTRRLLLQAATWFTRLTPGLQVSDSHNGLRAMTRNGASRFSIRQNRMAHASEILQQIADSGLRYIEVPVTIAYTNYSMEKGQRLSGSVDIVLDLLANRLQR
jgi:glycosyltransferase involved in cell wall biosynthesis